MLIYFNLSHSFKILVLSFLFMPFSNAIANNSNSIDNPEQSVKTGTGVDGKNCQFFFDQAEYKKALEPCKKAAKQDDLAAQTILGELLDNGSAGIVDQQQALLWWSKAAEKNYTEAENLLALKYYYGGTIFEKQPFWQQDYTKALDIWSKSARLGKPAAQFMVAEMHRLGQGTAINLIEAYAWYKLALERKYLLAEELMYETSKLMSSQDKKLSNKIYLDYLSKY